MQQFLLRLFYYGGRDHFLSVEEQVVFLVVVFVFLLLVDALFQDFHAFGDLGLKVFLGDVLLITTEEHF